MAKKKSRSSTSQTGSARETSQGAHFDEHDPNRRSKDLSNAGEPARKGKRHGIVDETKEVNKSVKKSRK